MDLTFYTHPRSRGRMVRWMLEETGQPYETKIIEFGPEMKSPAYLAINPMGKIPALRHGDTVVTECAAIIAYLADAFPEAHLAPAITSKQRGAYYRWMFFAAGAFEAAITNQSLGVTIPPERAGMVGYGSLKAVLEVLEAAVSKSTYILGEEFSAADVYIGSQIGFGMLFGSIEKRPGFKAYWDRLKDRPAALRAVELDGPMPSPA